MSEYNYQVIIVGAGPAGSLCAYRLAELGIKVLIIEKEKLPRFKPCGGALSLKSERLIDFDISEVIANKVNEINIKYNDEEITYKKNRRKKRDYNRSYF